MKYIEKFKKVKSYGLRRAMALRLIYVGTIDAEKALIHTLNEDIIAEGLYSSKTIDYTVLRGLGKINPDEELFHSGFWQIVGKTDDGANIPMLIEYFKKVNDWSFKKYGIRNEKLLEKKLIVKYNKVKGRSSLLPP